MHSCPLCHLSFSRRDSLLRHQRRVHTDTMKDNNDDQKSEITFKHPFTMVVSDDTNNSKKTHLLQ